MASSLSLLAMTNKTAPSSRGCEAAVAIQKKRLKFMTFWIATYGLLAMTDQGFVSSLLGRILLWRMLT